MNPESSVAPGLPVRVKIFGIGSAGVALLGASDFAGPTYAAVDTDAGALAAFAGEEKIHLETKMLRGLGTGGDPERGRELAEAHFAQLKSTCSGVDVVFLFAGLGGGAGTGMTPVLARAAKEAGALVLAFVTLPFDCEGSRRHSQARSGLTQLKAVADGVICLPCQKIVGLLNAELSLLDTFKSTTQFVLDSVRGVLRLLTHRSLIPLHFTDVCSVLRERQAESWFAVVEAAGPDRAAAVVEKLLAHPALDGGSVLADADVVLVSLMGGPELSLADVNRVMEPIKHRSPRAQLMLGAVVDESFRERLSLTVIATHGKAAALEAEPALPPRKTVTSSAPSTPNLIATPETATRPVMMKTPRTRKAADRLRQVQLQLDIANKSRFDKTEATILNGEDLDVPTFIRRGIALN
jgi:cell division protein FtsZ